MLNQVLTKVFGSKHERDVKRMLPVVAAINALEPETMRLSDEELRAKTAEFRERLAQGATLDDLLVEAFAVAREAARRALGMRPFDVQLMGGMVLHQGKIAEMKTGEGKTLVATLPVYLNALEGKGVHVVTVNDYLAKRDAEWMGERLPPPGPERRHHPARPAGRRAQAGLRLRHHLRHQQRARLRLPARQHEVRPRVDGPARPPLRDRRRGGLDPDRRGADAADHLGALRGVGRQVLPHRPHHPPLERGEESEDKDGVKHTTGDFLIDEKAHTATLTEEGVAKVEKLLDIENLYDMDNMELLHGVNQGLRAHHLYKRDVEYLIKDGQVVIVDEFTGRMMPGRRWSDGLHQAVEAKEGVKIERENQTLATITFQNYFRMYDKLAGMTGTADTEASEFHQIYKLEVEVIPTNQDMIRDDRADVVYRTAGEKWSAAVDEIAECHASGQPVLVGTVSIEKSEMLSGLLKRKGVPHVVLNAKYHEREAAIVAQAGRKGAVTIATNMAGRGTDIVLGGNPAGLARAEADPAQEPEAYQAALERYTVTCARERDEVLQAGGLHILGTERHESRRIDNQLRGRSGRQGDPGSSRFYLSLEDDLMRIFGSERIQGLMGKLGMEEGEAIEHGMVSRAIERAQKQVEGRNFEIRKHLLEYDDVMNKQREAIYRLRKDILEGREGREYVLKVATDILDYVLQTHCPEKADPRDWNLQELATDVLAYFDLDVHALGVDLESLGIEELRATLWEKIEGKYVEKEARLGPELMRVFERDILLRVVDHAWKEHLLALDHLKEGIGLRGYGQRDPLNEYKRESYELFLAMKERVEDTVIKTLYRLEPISQEQMDEERRRQERAAAAASASRFQFSAPAKTSAPQQLQTVVHKEAKVGRNDPCPCGSGKKYKKCHGAAAPVGA